MWLARRVAALAAGTLRHGHLLPSVSRVIHSRANQVLDEMGTRPYIQIRTGSSTCRTAGQLMSDTLRIAVGPRDFSDWPALLDLLRASFAHMDGRIDPPSSLAGLDIDALRTKAAAEHLIVAFDGATLAGCLFAAIRDDCIYLGKLAVAAAARRRGMARALIDAAEYLAREHGRAALELQTRIDLTENHATFAALGFVKVAETAHPGYARPTGITMRRRLD